jgi:hypothetical protein
MCGWIELVSLGIGFKRNAPSGTIFNRHDHVHLRRTDFCHLCHPPRISSYSSRYERDFSHHSSELILSSTRVAWLGFVHVTYTIRPCMWAFLTQDGACPCVMPALSSTRFQPLQNPYEILWQHKGRELNITDAFYRHEESDSATRLPYTAPQVRRNYGLIPRMYDF